jgi:hypothetical protein
MKLYLSPNSDLTLKYDDHNDPYFLDRVKFENSELDDQISDVDCIVETYINHNGEIAFKVLDIRCFNNLVDDKLQVKCTDRERFQIEIQIYNLISF